MAKKRLNIKDKTGLPVDYDISAENVTIDGEGGKPLTQKLQEITETEAQAVRSITFNGQSYNRDNGIINIGEQEQPNWNESNPNYRTYIRNKPTLLSQFTNDCGFVTSSQIPEGADLSTVFASVAYDPTTSRINFFGKGSNTVLAYLDAAPFIVDGMVENVTLDSSTNELVITFNTASGKSPIRVPLGPISGQGTVQSVKMNGGTPIQPVNGVIDLGTVITEHQSLSSYATKSELSGKQDRLTGSDVLATINSTQVHYGDSVNIEGQKGPKGDKGDTGNVEFEDLADLVALLVNDLTTGGAGNFLSAEMGLLLKSNVNTVQANIQKLYNKLANMAFWNASDRAEAAPTALDWDVPKKTLAITNDIEHAVVKYNGVEVNSVQVDAGETISLLVEGTPGWTVATVSASGATVIDNGDGTFTVRVKVNNDMTLAISGTAEAAVMFDITYNLTNCSKTSGPSAVVQGGGTTIVIEPAANHALPLAVSVTGATLTSYNKATGEIVISNATGSVTINADAICVDYKLVIGGCISSLYTTANPPYYMQMVNPVNRATIVLERVGITNPCIWKNIPNSDSNNPYSQQAMATYSTIPIPYGCTTVKIKMSGSSYNMSSALLSSSGQNLKESQWDSAQASPREYMLSNHVGATHVALNFKLANNGTIPDTTTISDLGFELIFE